MVYYFTQKYFQNIHVQTFLLWKVIVRNVLYVVVRDVATMYNVRSPLPTCHPFVIQTSLFNPGALHHTVPARVYVGAKKFAQGFTYMGVFPTHGGVHICWKRNLWSRPFGEIASWKSLHTVCSASMQKVNFSEKVPKTAISSGFRAKCYFNDPL